MKNKAFPSGKQSIAVAAFCIFAMFIFYPINSILNDLVGESISFLIYYILTMGSTYVIFYLLKKKNEGAINMRLIPKNILVVFLLIVSTLCIQWSLTMPLGDLIPMPDSIKEVFIELFLKMNNIYGLITVAIAAPILEELVFRGIILDGLLKRRSPLSAILISSFLFGFVHLNPWQFIAAMILGMFIGWVYYRTKNLFYCILIHFTNNFAASVTSIGETDTSILDMELVEMYGGETNMMIIIPLCLVLAGSCIYVLHKRMQNEELVDPSDYRINTDQ